MIRAASAGRQIDAQRRNHPATRTTRMPRNHTNDDSEYSTDDNRLTAPPGEQRLVVPTDDADAVNEIATADDDGILRSWDGCCLIEGEYKIEGEPTVMADGAGEQVTDGDPHTVDVEVASDELREKAPDDYDPICQVSISSGGHVTTFVLDTAEVAKLMRGVESALDKEGERQDGDRDE